MLNRVISGIIFLSAMLAVAATAPGRMVDDSDKVVLHGNVHPLARAEFDRGPSKAALQMERMVLTLRRSPDRQAELEKLLTELHDPASPGFHGWLSPEEFGRRFGPNREEIDAITRWLTSHGFVVEEVPNGRAWINFSGSVIDVERAFHTQMHDYYVDNEIHHANAYDPAIPRGFSDLVAGVVSLNDFPRRAMLNVIRPVLQPEAAPAYTTGTSHYLSPGDFATIYNVDALYGAGIDGSGQSVAIVGRTHPSGSNWTAFRTMMGLPVNPPQVIVNGPDPGDLGGNEDIEADLDVEWSGAVARKATIILVVSKSTYSTDGVDLSAQYIVDNNLSPVMSTSFNSCETDMGAAENNFYYNLWQQAAAQGITSFVASGDAGAAGCNAASDATGSGPGVNGLASTPFNMAVGGTKLNEGTGTYWNGTNGSAYTSVVGYIPEVAWNESGSVPGGSGLWAGGGGVSSIYGKPPWQASPGVPDDGKRDVPDVSLSAAAHDAYLVRTLGALYAVSGTSASSPSFAGLMALIVQKTGQRQGNADVRLYQLGNAQYNSGGAAVFHDIASGDNSVPGVAGYSSGTGYDLATGLGSVDAEALINNWTPDFAISISPAALSIPQGSAGTAAISASVSGNFGNDISLSASGLPAGATATFNPNPIVSPDSGGSTLTISAGFQSPAGVYPVTITGTGGGVSHAAAVNLTVLQVFSISSSVAGGTGGTISPNTSTVVSGGSIVLTIAPANGYHLTALIDNGIDVTSNVNGNSYIIAGVNSTHNVVAAFEINTYNVAASASGGHGSIAPTNSTVNYGSAITLTITPDSGYSISTLTDNGAAVIAIPSGDGSYTYTVSSVTGNHTIQITFGPQAVAVPAIGFREFLAATAVLCVFINIKRRNG